MIYINTLGRNGRLGNQLFQYATGYALAKKHNTHLSIPSKDANEEYSQIVETFELSNAIYNDFEGIKSHYEEGSFSYNPHLMNLSDGVNIKGYFQSEKYFSHVKSELINKEFKFKYNVELNGRDSLERLCLNDKILCSIHLRMGDYLNSPAFHNGLPIEYYLKCINKISEMEDVSRVHYLVFSDDIQRTREFFKECNLQMSFIDTDYQNTIWLMSKCKHHIIANSSFSWWGAWLSSSEGMVFAPSIWFGVAGPQNWHDIYCERWVIV